MSLELVTYGGLTWLNIEDPAQTEMEYLRQRYPFHVLDLEDCVSGIERPKLDVYDDYLFIVMHFPRYETRRRVSVPSQVSLFVGSDFVVTVHDGTLEPMVQMFQLCKADDAMQERLMGRGSGELLYRIIDRLVDYVFPILRRVGKNINGIEEEVFRNEHDTLRDAAELRRDIMALRRIMRPQIAVVSTLERTERAFLKENMEVYFGDVVDHLNRLWDTLDDYREVVEGLFDSANWLSNDRLNAAIRVLSALQAIFLPATLIASIWGMNVAEIPLSNSVIDFLILNIIMLATIVGTLIFLFRHRWI